MKYKKITNREAVELFLAGSDKLRVKPPGFNVPMRLSKDIPAMEFADGSKCEFYVEDTPKPIEAVTTIYPQGEPSIIVGDIKEMRMFWPGPIRITYKIEAID